MERREGRREKDAHKENLREGWRRKLKKKKGEVYGGRMVVGVLRAGWWWWGGVDLWEGWLPQCTTKGRNRLRVWHAVSYLGIKQCLRHCGQDNHTDLTQCLRVFLIQRWLCRLLISNKWYAKGPNQQCPPTSGQSDRAAVSLHFIYSPWHIIYVSPTAVGLSFFF